MTDWDANVSYLKDNYILPWHMKREMIPYITRQKSM